MNSIYRYILTKLALMAKEKLFVPLILREFLVNKGDFKRFL